MCYQKSADVHHRSVVGCNNQDSMGNSNLEAVLGCAVQSSFHPYQQVSVKIQVGIDNLFKAMRRVLSAAMMVNALVLLL